MPAGAALLASQPQVNGGVGNKLDFSAALAIEPGGATVETFGVVFATARTQVDKVERNVVFENLQISRTDVPTLPQRDADCTAALQKSQPQHLRSISPGRLQASLAAAGVQHIGVQVQNEAPQVIVRCSPGILVPVDGAPVWNPVPGGQCTERMK